LIGLIGIIALFIRFVAADRATNGGARQSVMSRHVAWHVTGYRAVDAAHGHGRKTSRRSGDKHQTEEQTSFHREAPIPMWS
jgi:hypothetical protein